MSVHSDIVSLRPNCNASKITLSSSSPAAALISDPAPVISPVDVTAAPTAMSIPDDIQQDSSSLKSSSGSDVTFDPSRNAKKETEHQRIPLPVVTVIAHDLILTIVNSAAPREFMSDGLDRFVLDTCNEISAFLNEANIGLSPATEKRSWLMNEAVSFYSCCVSFDLTFFCPVTQPRCIDQVILTTHSLVVAIDAQDTRTEAANPNLETVNPYQAEKQGPALTVNFSSPNKETIGLMKTSAQAIFAARDSNNFDIIADVSSFLDRDVDAVHLCKLPHSGLDAFLSFMSPFLFPTISRHAMHLTNLPPRIITT